MPSLGSVLQVDGVLSHQMKRFVIDGNKVVINKPSSECKVEECKFEENEVSKNKKQSDASVYFGYQGWFGI
jgi:hypothetical protein